MLPTAETPLLCLPMPRSLDSTQNVLVDTNDFPSHTCGTYLQTLLFFPHCVDEQTLEVAYKSRTRGTYEWCSQGAAQPLEGQALLKQACANAYCAHGNSSTV
jgi:hypothetical protein